MLKAPVIQLAGAFCNIKFTLISTLSVSYTHLDGSKLVTGVVIANNEFVQDHADKVNDFMDAYKESVDFVNSDTEDVYKRQVISLHLRKRQVL